MSANHESRARAMLDAGQPDAVVELLQGEGANGHAERCALLAEAYFTRGDTKGDLYSAHFFAGRAMELGASSPALLAIKAISAFRKEEFAEAAATFAAYVTGDSGSAAKHMLGLALLRTGDAEGALPWLKGALDADPENGDFRQAVEEAETRVSGGKREPAPPPPQKRQYALGGVKDTRELDADAPYETNALTKLAGISTHPKDLYWLAKNIPCQKGCPAHTDVPGYLAEIYKGNYDAAYLINLKDNVFPAVLGRVCARPCEPECRHGWEGLGESVAICFSKRSAADLKGKDPVVLDPLFERSGKRVAVIGSGVAGLATARNLAWYGHTVTVYEKHVRPGGMMNQGIPVFRLPREHIEREIKQIELMGVEIKCGVEIGKDINLATLLAENDAVVMAAGTLRPNMLDLPGKELSGIRHGLDFLLEANEEGEADVPEKVVVIGGGFTAMDCARTAKRLGARLVKAAATDGSWHDIALTESLSDVNVLYRRSVDEMLVTPGEIEELEHEGIGMDILISPVEYLGEDGKLTGVRFIRNALGEPDASGRRRPVPVEGSEFDVDADLVLLATGQFPDADWIDDELKPGIVEPDGWLTSGKSIETANPKLFAVGDFATGASSLIDAIKHARKCARELDGILMGTKRLAKMAIIEDVTESGRIREMDYVDVQTMPTLPLNARTTEAEVEQGYDPSLACEETQRCYRCNLKYEIDSDKCIYCDWCIKAKPRPDCIVKVKELVYSEKGEITGFVRAEGSEDTNLIYINQEDCIRCGACVDACPVDCISIQSVTRTTAPLPREK